MPLLDGTKEHFIPFSEARSKPLSERDRPSLGHFINPEAKEIDKTNKSLLTNSKVRGILDCHECGKPRCIYSVKKLDIVATRKVDDIRCSKLYVCGSFLFLPDSMYHSTIVVRQALSCEEHVEVQYYSSTLCSFPPVCYHCGGPEETLLNNEEVLN